MSRSILASRRRSAVAPAPCATKPCTPLDQMAEMWGSKENALALTQAFVECCESNCSIETLVSTFQKTLERLGFRYFACCSHVDPLHPPKTAVMLHNYPGPWERTFSELFLYEDDPVLLYSEQCELPFSWDEAAFRANLTRGQQIILAEGASLGLVRGYTTTIHSPVEWGAMRASCSVVPDAGSIDAASYIAVQIMANYLYHTVRKQLCKQHGVAEGVALTVRERQCLELAARGKSDWVIGRVLGLSECTVHTYIERAKQRMGVATRVQAVVQALAAKQISWETRSERPESIGRPRSGVDRRALLIRDSLLRELKRSRAVEHRHLAV